MCVQYFLFLSPQNALGRCPRKLSGSALEQEALAGIPPKKLSRALLWQAFGRPHCSRRALGALPRIGPCMAACKSSLRRCAMKFWKALEQEAFAGIPRKKLSRTLLSRKLSRQKNKLSRTLLYRKLLGAGTTAGKPWRVPTR